MPLLSFKTRTDMTIHFWLPDFMKYIHIKSPNYVMRSVSSRPISSNQVQRYFQALKGLENDRKSTQPISEGIFQNYSAIERIWKGVIFFSTHELLLEALAWKVLGGDEGERGRQRLLFIEPLLKYRHFRPFILFNFNSHLR